jgi:hypothetical protein
VPSPSDPDLWYPGDCIDPRDVEDEPEPDVDEEPGELLCVECEQPCGSDLLCEDCEQLIDATSGDLEESDMPDTSDTPVIYNNAIYPKSPVLIVVWSHDAEGVFRNAYGVCSNDADDTAIRNACGLGEETMSGYARVERNEMSRIDGLPMLGLQRFTVKQYTND